MRSEPITGGIAVVRSASGYLVGAFSTTHPWLTAKTFILESETRWLRTPEFHVSHSLRWSKELLRNPTVRHTNGWAFGGVHTASLRIQNNAIFSLS